MIAPRCPTPRTSLSIMTFILFGEKDLDCFIQLRILSCFYLRICRARDNIGCQPGRGDLLAVRPEPASHSDLERRVIGDREELLNDALAKGVRTDEFCDAVVAQRI